MPDSQFKPGTGIGPQGKMSKIDKLMRRNIKQQERALSRKMAKWNLKAEEIKADEGEQAAQSFIEKKLSAFQGKETKSERIAAEVEEGLREPGGKKKPGYKKPSKKPLREDQGRGLHGQEVKPPKKKK